MIEITFGFLVLCFLAAVFAGFFGGLFGIGGGAIIVPFLTVYMGVPIHQAIAISLVAVIATSNAGGSSYLEQKITNIKLAMYLEVATTIGALVGSVIALLLQSWILFAIFGILLCYVAISNFKSRTVEESRIAKNSFANVKQDRISRYLGLAGTYYDASQKKRVDYQVNGSAVGAAISSFAGVTAGLLGVGGGIIKVAAMNLLMNVPLKASVATSKFMIGVTAAVGALVFFVTGLVNVYVLAPVALGITLGATFGTSIMNRIRSYALKVAFAFLVTYLAYTMFAQALVSFGIIVPMLG